MNKIVPLHPRSTSIGHYIRLGWTAHRRLEDWLAAGSLPISRAVIDAAHCREQRDLAAALGKQGVELVLDPKTAELATPGGSIGKARELPWAHHESFWQPHELTQDVLRRHAEHIAEFAVKCGASAVLAPAHFLRDDLRTWIGTDRFACELLRGALDRNDGRDIAIDYPLIFTQSLLKNPAQIRELLYELQDAPFSYLWIRVAGFGSQATAGSLKRYIEAIDLFATLGKPVISDYVGGLIGLACCSVGAASGIAHGITEKEKFDASSLWRRSRGHGGGGSPRIYLADLDLYMSCKQFDSLLGVRGAKPKLICNDSACCPHGIDDMRKASRRHFLIQRVRQVEKFENVPVHRRSDYVVRELERAGRLCRAVERLPELSQDPEPHNKIRRFNARIDRLPPALIELAERRRDMRRPPAARLRNNRSTRSASGY
jgi:hypothetical protein